MKNKIFFLLIFFITSCAVTRGGFNYKVKRNESLSYISKKFDLPERVIKRLNGLTKQSIKAGTILYIPVNKKNLTKISRFKKKKYLKTNFKKKKHKKKYYKISKKHKHKITKKRKFRKARRNNKSNFRFIWPIKGKVLSYYSSLTRGINIKISKNTNVKAVDDGKIIFKGILEGYGKTLIIKHKNKFLTVYSYLTKINVTLNENVKKKQNIAYLSLNEMNKKYKTPVLHFEIRKNIDDNPIAVNPLLYLE